jgi:hypothetical protein
MIGIALQEQISLYDWLTTPPHNDPKLFEQQYHCSFDVAKPGKPEILTITPMKGKKVVLNRHGEFELLDTSEGDSIGVKPERAIDKSTREANKLIADGKLLIAGKPESHDTVETDTKPFRLSHYTSGELSPAISGRPERQKIAETREECERINKL